MRKFYLILIAAVCSFAFSARAQDETNAPKTEIENFELQPDAVIVKGLGDIGTVTTSEGVITVRCKESFNVTTGRKEYGVAAVLDSKQLSGFMVMDYDELEPMIRGMDFLGKISYDATPMPSFDAALTTKSGLKIAAHSKNRQGGIQFFLQFADTPRIPLASDQFTQFETLIKQAKNSLDAMKNKSSAP